MNRLGSLPLSLLAAIPLMAQTTNTPLTTLERLEPSHLQVAHEARLRFTRERHPVMDHGLSEDVRSIIHVPTAPTRPPRASDGSPDHHALANLAKKAGARVVLLFEPPGLETAPWRGEHDGVLFLAAARAEDGTLVVPESNPAGAPPPGRDLKFRPYSPGTATPPIAGVTGMVIVDPLRDLLTAKLLQGSPETKGRWRAVLENPHYKAFPDEYLAAGTEYPRDVFAVWDQQPVKKPLTGIAATASDPLVSRDQEPGPDEVAFRNCSTHLLVSEVTEAAVREALRAGHAYVAYDWLCDPTSFTFGAVNNLGVFPMGDLGPLAGKTRLTALTPVPATLKLFMNGVEVHHANGTNLTFEAKEPGAYRVEAWLTVDGEERPWIYSDPVRLRSSGLGDMSLPSMEIAPTVELRKDLAYTDGPEDQAGKHKLDLYVPKDKALAPVFFFIHGGAWKYGDRSQYVPLGNRYAQAGFLTVVPSYRLAPKHPFPAQIEDVAAAFAWTLQHVGENGGDTNRIYVGGHSAGGHLAALLALDPTPLAKHGLSPKLIHGVLALSGVYNLTLVGGQSDVFGDDPIARRQASPLFHIDVGAPPFLVTYCQWDYFNLPAQAKELHTALRHAGLASELVYVPGQNHISEMLNVAAPDDPTVTAALRFMR